MGGEEGRAGLRGDVRMGAHPQLVGFNDDQMIMRFEDGLAESPMQPVMKYEDSPLHKLSLRQSRSPVPKRWPIEQREKRNPSCPTRKVGCPERF